jgi:hypothetical protein
MTIEDTRNYKATQYNITPEQVELFLKQCAESFDKSSQKTSFMATELAKLLNNNNQDHADDLKRYINISTWEEVILNREVA